MLHHPCSVWLMATLMSSMLGSAAAQTPIYEPQAITTVAGIAGRAGSFDGPIGAPSFSNPSGIAVDSNGNLYIADRINQTIRKIEPDGTVSIFAGLEGVSGSADGHGSAARFNYPSGVALDSAGNVYVADQQNNTIRKITPVGSVTTLAGLANSYGYADGTGPAARFNNPYSIAVDSAANVYVADTYNDTIRRITPGGVVTTLAGSPTSNGSADGIGNAARFNYPYGVTVDGAGNVYVADQNNNTIRKITPDRVVSTFAGLAGTYGSSADGIGSAARFNNPNGVTVDNAGNIYVSETSGHTIRKITANAVVSTLAGQAGVRGNMDGTGGAARFSSPAGISVDMSGYVYVADSLNDAIRKVSSDGVVTTLAGYVGFFNQPGALAVDTNGNLYVSDSGNRTIRKITFDGIVTTLAGKAGVNGHADGIGSAASFSYVAGIAVDRVGNIYVADFSTIRKVSAEGVVSTLAGVYYQTGSVDGPGNMARFTSPSGVAVDDAGNVYVSDSSNHNIRKITPSAVVSTLAGLNSNSGTADGTGTAARFNAPSGVAVDKAGNVYVADQHNHTIRKITSGGTVTTLAGSAGVYGSGDGYGSLARFHLPSGVAVDKLENVYVADASNNTIRKITSEGFVTTIAGSADFPSSGSGDGTGSAARFNNPASLAISTSGRLYITDTDNQTIRGGGLPAIASITQPDSSTIRIQGFGIPNAPNRLEFSPDLSSNSFATSVSIFTDVSGAFQYDSPNANKRGFYRLVYP